MKIFKLTILLLAITCVNRVNAQEVIPIYHDYLSDNVYLLHPAAAGVGNCAKFRMSHNQQWAGVEDSPGLQTLSYHSKLTESQVGLGGIMYKDSNGNHSQYGAQATFSYHIDMGGSNFNQLSFAMSGMYSAIQLDQTDFIITGEIDDPVISNLVEAENYFNADFGMAYHYKTGFAYFTIKNLLLTARDLENSTYESLNLRRYLGSLGYFIDNDNNMGLSFEPSIMVQYRERDGELQGDINFKAYKEMDKGNVIWAAVSYRKSFEGNKIQDLSQVTSILGINFNKVMLSYAYTTNLGDITFDNSGMHQLSLGIDLFCKKERIASCPNAK